MCKTMTEQNANVVAPIKFTKNPPKRKPMHQRRAVLGIAGKEKPLTKSKAQVDKQPTFSIKP
jgi:hypothetical protein